MVTAIDTNILVDIFSGSAQFGFSSLSALRRSEVAGATVICDVVYAEFCVLFPQRLGCDAFLDSFGISVEHLDLESSFQASRNWTSYLNAGGKKTRILPDFLIAGHAAYQADRLLTRDTGFRKKHFDGLTIVEP